MALVGLTPASGSTRDSTPTSTPACFAYLTLTQIKVSLHTPRNDKEALKRPSRPLTPPPEPPPSLPPNQSPSGPAPPPRPLPAQAKPPPHLPPLPTTTPGPLHYAVDALPATSPPLPSPAATSEADPQASVPTRLELTNRRRSGSNTYEGSLHALKRPCWPANPPSTLLPPTPPIADQPPVPFPAPLPPLWATPPAALNAPTSPVPVALTPVPPAPRCSMPTPTPPSPPALHLDPPLPIKAPPPMPSTPLPEHRPTNPRSPKTPRRFVKLPQHSAPTPANSGTFAVNSDGPLANSNIFPAAAGASPGLPEPLGPLPHHA
ncbi:hypothetical protein E4T56_gene768 [Termitomyces sp. T112]|nr:hypothetical protein E4T56_gene768 [Termitomyces sp. T112]